jgi:hypothetical protein
VKIWGIDSLDEESEPYLDQVWLQRIHPDLPQQWDVIAATTDDCLLTEIMLPDGTWVKEGPVRI